MGVGEAPIILLYFSPLIYYIQLTKQKNVEFNESTNVHTNNKITENSKRHKIFGKSEQNFQKVKQNW